MRTEQKIKTATATAHRPKRSTTGNQYPFSSKRQNDRYARQIAAGQIRNA